MAALFFLAFAFFAVGQAAVTRNGAQTAADAAAIGAARSARDGMEQDFLDALKTGDLHKLTDLLKGIGMTGDRACTAADTYAGDNHADITDCSRVDGPPGYTVAVRTQGTVGKSVVKGTEGMHATADATAIIEPRCTVGDKEGDSIAFTCDGEKVTVDPTGDDFTLHLAEFYSVHLSE